MYGGHTAPTHRAAQLLQRITDSRQQGVPVKTSLHPRRYRIQPSPATHGTDLTDPQRLVVARDALAPAYASVPCRHRPGAMVPLVGMTGAPCPDDAAGVLRIASLWGDPPDTAGLRTVAAAPKSIVRKCFRLILASCNATLSQKISADHLHHDPTVLDTHPAAFHPDD